MLVVVGAAAVGAVVDVVDVLVVVVVPDRTVVVVRGTVVVVADGGRVVVDGVVDGAGACGTVVPGGTVVATGATVAPGEAPVPAEPAGADGLMARYQPPRARNATTITTVERRTAIRLETGRPS